MSKMYVKDSNGKYRLTDKPEPIVVMNEQQPLSLEGLNVRLLKLEELLIELQK